LSDIEIILLVLCTFQVKHFLGDFVFQTPYMLQNRRYYGHPGGFLHTGVHVALSGVILLAVGTSFGLLAGLLLAEGLVHYHLDWIKDNYVDRHALTTQTRGYWLALGVDQGLHQITYLGMLWVWAAVMLT
jgi:hypothetical protein